MHFNASEDLCGKMWHSRHKATHLASDTGGLRVLLLGRQSRVLAVRCRYESALTACNFFRNPCLPNACYFVLLENYVQCTEYLKLSLKVKKLGLDLKWVNTKTDI